MDRPAIEELFGFTDFAWRTYTETLRGLGDDWSIRCLVPAGRRPGTPSGM